MKKYILSMQERIDCEFSYTTEDSPFLLCAFDAVCDGNLYECCLFNKFIDDNVHDFMMKEELE